MSADPRLELAALNRASAEQFAESLAGIYEHSPWIAVRAAAARPFASRLDLLAAMQAVVLAATRDEQLALVRAHPQLAGQAAVRGELTAESTREQAGAGLSECSAEQFERLQTLNQAYNQRFGFPFVLAVKGHDRDSVLRAFEQRLGNEPETELATALGQIERIAEFRLGERLREPMGASILAMADHLRQYSDDEDGLSCTFLGAAHRATAQRLCEWMRAAGLQARIDAIGNVVGRCCCGRADAKTLLIGSHYDTVVNGGAYDGRLGILLPIVVAEHLRHSGVKLDFDLEIISFSDEEGVRFGSTYLGSRAITGQFDLGLLERRDADGISLREALLDAGLDPQAIPSLARDPDSLLGYLEVHIEQGPQLLDEDLPLGVVTAINGSQRFLIRIEGSAGHAGTVPMHLRHDAAAAAAEILLYTEKRCTGRAGLVGTVGRLQVPGGAVNVIPGRCELSLDVRAPEDATRDAAVADILAEIERIAARRGVRIALEEVLKGAATPCAPAIRQALADSIRRVTRREAVRQLASGAGHDAVPLASLTPAGMLFVRCGNGGISHHPDETLSELDAEIAARVVADFVVRYPSAGTRR